jgi:hypothetical protein
LTCGAKKVKNFPCGAKKPNAFFLKVVAFFQDFFMVYRHPFYGLWPIFS